VSTLLSPSKSAGGGSVRKAVIVETSQEGKPEHSQRAGTATQVSGGGVNAERGAVTSPPPRGTAALDQDETQVHPADDMAVDDKPGQAPAGQEETAAKQHDGGIEPAAEADGDGIQQDSDEGDHEQQQQQQQQGVGSNSQQGEPSQQQQGADGAPAQDEVAVDETATKELPAEESHPADAAMQEEDAVAPPQDDSSPAADGLADDMEERSSPGDDEVRDSESNGFHIAAEGQAQADTLVAPSMANVSMGNSLDGML